MEYKTLYWEKEEGIATVTFNRPEALNAMNTDMCLDIVAVCSELAADPDVRVVILTGGGRAFIAGADIAYMQPLTSAQALDFLNTFKAAIKAIEGLPQPTIAAVNGFAFGGGNELCLGCDIRLASEKAKFGQQEINLGIIPGGGGSQRLPRLVGWGRAMEMALSGEAINAEEAYRIGLANRVFPHDSLLDEAKKLARLLASKPKVALRQAKAVINASKSLDMESGLDYEIQCCALLWSTDDQKEGMKAFLEKREPGFTGR
ncbi:enoyl-CoA hydratase/isomerase family protein [Chloroflexota bacterium]